MELEYDSWLLAQINCLRDRDFEKLDTPGLIEELEALVRGEKSAVESFAYQILLHLLLIDYWHEESEWNRRDWRSLIDSCQFQLNGRLTTNLKVYLHDRLDFIYAKARKNAISKTGLSNRLPEQMPYTLSQILDEEFDCIDKVGDRIDRVAAVVEQQAKTAQSLVDTVNKLLDGHAS